MYCEYMRNFDAYSRAPGERCGSSTGSEIGSTQRGTELILGLRIMLRLGMNSVYLDME